ncbi:MAG: molybdate ABC transporter substrate-binding protein [Hyphomicrobiaceae bacterium]|nr:molybdate ABC transporter substrate-binding protein [Hyphomicrobiaceae bacterium]MCC0024074.1 molybdate ABC transporter substrate-binding protein [Hyphomicrobiaceae bacterium]
MKRTFWVFSLFALAVLGTPARAEDLEKATVFAAASLIDALGAAAEDFKKETGRDVVLVTGSSSTLSKQIVAGAPADDFISANRIYADAVAEAFDTEAHDLFGNSLVLIAPADFEGDVDPTSIADALGAGRLALGDPAHVPAGIYAKEALENLGEWDVLENRLAPASDVRGALNFVAAGAAPLGIVYKTDANDPRVKVILTFPESSHTPIRYWGVQVNPDNVTAELFLTYLGSFKGQVLLDYYGFKTVTSLPSEDAQTSD